MGDRSGRGFGAGALSIVIAANLAGAGYSSFVIGVLLGLALGGAAVWAIAVPRLELRWRRRPGVRSFGARLGVGRGTPLGRHRKPCGPPGCPSPRRNRCGGADVSPLGALEQAALAGTTEPRSRTDVRRLQLARVRGIAVGALAAGPLSSLGGAAFSGLPSGPHDTTLLFYGLLGLGLIPAYQGLSW